MSTARVSLESVSTARVSLERVSTARVSLERVCLQPGCLWRECVYCQGIEKNCGIDLVRIARQDSTESLVLLFSRSHLGEAPEPGPPCFHLCS